VRSAYQGGGKPGSTIVPSAYSNYHWEPPKDQAFTFDLDKAGRLLDQAGYTKGKDGFRTLPDGSPLGTLRLYARSDTKASVDTMNFFQEWLADLGIKSKVTAMDSGKLGEAILDGTFDAFQWDWFVEPDPDSILSDMTCAQRGGLSDSWYCNKAYDALYNQQNGEMDEAKRVAEVKRMQQMVFEDAPYLVTAYTTTGEAVRSDRFACFEPQPDPGGVWLVQYGAHNYVSLRPVDKAGNCDGVTSALGATKLSSSASSTGSGGDGGGSAVLIGGGVVLLVLLAGGGLLAFRRRATAGERE
jgi:peptide/nickel transport system substrate-binding protein